MNTAFYLERWSTHITFLQPSGSAYTKFRLVSLDQKNSFAMEDTEAQREVSPASYQYQLIEHQSKSEHILQHVNTATTRDSHLSPRKFTESRPGNTFCFGDKSPRDTSSRIDPRYILPAASLVCLVSVVPIIVYATTHKQMAQIKFTTQYDNYDCS